MEQTARKYAVIPSRRALHEICDTIACALVMPPSKSKLKAIQLAVCEAQFVKIPRLEKPPCYRHWLNNLLRTPHNRKFFAKSTKVAVDELYRQTASQQFRKDKISLWQAVTEVTKPMLYSKGIAYNEPDEYRG